MPGKQSGHVKAGVPDPATQHTPAIALVLNHTTRSLSYHLEGCDTSWQVGSFSLSVKELKGRKMVQGKVKVEFIGSH